MHREVENSLQLFVVEEVIERPQITVVCERITLGHGFVRIHVAIKHFDRGIDRLPQNLEKRLLVPVPRRPNFTTLHEQRIYVRLHVAQRPFLGEMLRAQTTEVVIRIDVIQSQYKIN